MSGIAAIGTGLQAFGVLQRGRDMAAGLFSAALAHPLAAGLALSLGANLWQWHEGAAESHAAARRLAVWQRAFAGEQGAFASLMGSYRLVLRAADSERQGIDALAADSARRRDAAARAVAAAARRGDRLMALSAQLSAGANARPPAPSPACQTPADVMAARGQL